MHRIILTIFGILLFTTIAFVPLDKIDQRMEAKFTADTVARKIEIPRDKTFPTRIEECLNFNDARVLIPMLEDSILFSLTYSPKEILEIEIPRVEFINYFQQLLNNFGNGSAELISEIREDFTIYELVLISEKGNATFYFLKNKKEKIFHIYVF